MHEEQAGGPDGVVPGLLNDDQRQIRLVKDRELSGQVEHAGIGADQAIPLSKVIQRKQELPIIHPS